MVVKVLGVESVTYKFDDGKVYTGKKIHCIETDYCSDGLTGQRVNVLKVSNTSRFSDFPFVVGKDYDVYFTQKGGVDYVALHQIEDPVGYVDSKF